MRILFNKKRHLKNCSCGCVKGNVREINQDNFYFAGKHLEPNEDGLKTVISETIDLMEDDNQGYLFAVLDGMGGGQHGEIASYVAAKTMSDFMPHCETSNETANSLMLEELCKTINARVYVAGEEIGASVMGTTMAALYFRGGRVWSCNVGDSRCYRIRKGVLEMLSEDHVEELYNVDMLIRNKKPRLIQYLGMNPEEILLEPTIKCDGIEDDDIYMICSDGLTDMVMEADISKIINDAADAESATNKLIDTALSNGGKDNLTVIVCRCGRRG